MPIDWKKAETRLIQPLSSLTRVSRRWKFALVVLNDAILCVLAVLIAFSLRLGVWQLWEPAVLLVMAVSLCVWLPLFLVRGTYRTIVRHLGTRTAVNIATSSLLMGLTTSLIYIAFAIPNVPRTIGAIHAMTFAALMMISRLIASYVLFDLPNQRSFSGRVTRVLIYGAGSAGRQLATSLRHEPGMLVCGYLEDDARLSGHRVDGIPIYAAQNLAALIENLDIGTVALALPKITRQRRELIVRKFAGIKVHVLTLPAVGDLMSGSVSIADLREIEIEDLLGRDAIPPNQLLLRRSIAEQAVMVTGAGGSIGSELCRQIAALKPKSLILVEMTEHALYAIENELREAQRSGVIDQGIALFAELSNIADRAVSARVMKRWKPHTVFHAAAYKHVPLIEENVVSGIRNNIMGTLHCVREAERNGVTRFVLVSTDKAVRPTNVMGATKRACEMILQAVSARQSSTTFAMVRFGNVLGSSGSVVPMFQRQIRAGGPVTLTHVDITRYFMTIPEAAQLVIQAGAMARGGEVYVLDMGEPIRIYDLARTMINLSGLSVRDEDCPDGDIEIEVVGLRKGEKLYEELLIGNSPRETKHPRIMQATEPFLDWADLDEAITAMRAAIDQDDPEGALAVLSQIVPEYQGDQSAKRQANLA